MNLYWIAALIVGSISVASAGIFFGGSGAKRQPLAELGFISVPTRLDPYATQEADGFAVFSFDSTPSSIFLMGSSRPVSEVLAVSVWRPDARAAALKAVTSRAVDRTDQITWTTRGEYRIGVGVHEVNASKHDARIVVREFPDRQLTIGHMSWIKRSLSEARQIELIEASFTSLEQRTPVAEYLLIAADRPRMLTDRHRAALRKLLSVRTVPYKVDGPIVERDGTFYDCYIHSHWGEMITAVHPLGDLPAARSFRELNPATPPDVPNWPFIVTFQWNGTEWAMEGSPELSTRMTAQLSDRHQDRSRAYFYAVASDSPQPTEPSEFRIDVLWRAIPGLNDHFKRGTLIQPLN
ncbi:hypothetical protein [Steroidobacter sp.]|uniref:hypothetical protein n=1 Tax=Steroidobacter sp. TaxID=1978227 RepID=UPI001A5E0D2B|nr:hypothetical protein [Steroidobacter sp.]MBL8265499.1 hypothetical protein [Steroidobacter sp.]